MWKGCGHQLGRGTDGGVGGDGRDGDRDRYGLSLWEDNVSKTTLGTEPNAPLAYDPGLEHHYPITITIGDPGGQLYIERERYTSQYFIYQSIIK